MGCEVFILILVSRVYIGKAFLDNKILLEQLPLPKFIFSTPTIFFCLLARTFTMIRKASVLLPNPRSEGEKNAFQLSKRESGDGR